MVCGLEARARGVLRRQGDQPSTQEALSFSGHQELAQEHLTVTMSQNEPIIPS
jgi:hypothetical protein